MLSLRAVRDAYHCIRSAWGRIEQVKLKKMLSFVGNDTKAETELEDTTVGGSEMDLLPT